MNEKQMLGTLLIKTSSSTEWSSQDISIKDGIFLVGSFVLPLPTAFLRVLPPGGNACPSPYAFEILTERGESFVDCWVNSILSLGNPPQHKLARRVSSSNRIAKELSWVNIIEIVFVITLLNLLLILILYSDPAHVESWVFVGMINVLVGYAVTKQEFKQGMVSTTAVQKDEFETNSAEGEEEDDESPSSSLLHIIPPRNNNRCPNNTRTLMGAEKVVPKKTIFGLTAEDVFMAVKSAEENRFRISSYKVLFKFQCSVDQYTRIFIQHLVFLSSLLFITQQRAHN
jgi:hypothetical protein